MKKIILYLFMMLFAGTIVFISCKKELSCEGCKENKPPIAIAGPDQVITLPIDSISLDGSASNDPDGTISVWLWQKISGPASFNILNTASAKSIVRNLDTGVYCFELKVTDNGSLSATDTIQITVTDPRQPNRPPVAIAGADQTITLPTNTITLNGSTSTDPDYNISSYAWTKISGPSSFSMSNGNAVQTQVTNLVQGNYQFELKVTDAGGLFSRDTVHVNVNPALNQPCVPNTLIQANCDNSMRLQVCGQLISVGTLSGSPWAVASAGNKLVFTIPGAINNVNDLTLDIYDLAVQTWSTKYWNFSQPLANYDVFPTVIGVGNKVLFAGGETDILTWDDVQIYDVSADSWSISHLSGPGTSFAAATCGEKAFFASGFEHDPGRVDIYNATTASWSTATLSVPRYGVTAFSGNSKVYFTGGSFGQISNLIDIYDNVTNTWSTSTMQSPRIFHSGVSVNDILYLAGGIDHNCPCDPFNPNLCSIETLNTTTGNRTTMNVFGPVAWQTHYGQNALIKNNKIIFLRQLGGGDANKFDIYDVQSNTWSIGILPLALPLGAISISVNNTIYIAGGSGNTQVWKLEF